MEAIKWNLSATKGDIKTLTGESFDVVITLITISCNGFGFH